MNLKGIIAGGVGWAVLMGVALRLVSSRWHPDRGRSIEEALTPYMSKEDWKRTEERMTRKENG